MNNGKYTAAIVEKIVELLSTGEHSAKQVSEAVGITEQTFYNWKKEKPKFAQKLAEAEQKRLDGLGTLARSGLAKLIDVYEYEETTTEIGERQVKGAPKGTKEPYIKGKKIVKKKIMPNPTAVIFALTNLDPDNWKHKNHTELSTTDKTFFELMKQASTIKKQKDG